MRLKGERGLSISVDRILDRMRSYLGLPKSSVFKIIKNKVRSGVSSKQTVQFKPRGRPEALDFFDRALIERAVHKMYDQKIAPAVDKIKTDLSETLIISKTILSLTLLDMGFTYRKRGDNRNLFNNHISITNDRINYLRKIKQYRDDGMKWFI